MLIFVCSYGLSVPCENHLTGVNSDSFADFSSSILSRNEVQWLLARRQLINNVDFMVNRWKWLAFDFYVGK